MLLLNGHLQIYCSLSTLTFITCFMNILFGFSLELQIYVTVISAQELSIEFQLESLQLPNQLWVVWASTVWIAEGVGDFLFGFANTFWMAFCDNCFYDLLGGVCWCCANCQRSCISLEMGVNYLYSSAVCTVISVIGLQWWTHSALSKIKSDGLIGEEGVHPGNATHVLELLLDSYVTVALLLNFALNVFILLILSLKVW